MNLELMIRIPKQDLEDPPKTIEKVNKALAEVLKIFGATEISTIVGLSFTHEEIGDKTIDEVTKLQDKVDELHKEIHKNPLLSNRPGEVEFIPEPDPLISIVEADTKQDFLSRQFGKKGIA